MNPRVKTALLLVVSLAVVGANQAIPATAPMYIHAVAFLFAAGAILASLFHAPPSVIDTLNALLGAVTAPPPANSLDDTHPAVLAARRIVRRSTRLLPVGVLAIFCSGAVYATPAAVVVSTEACHETPAQIGAQIGDGLKLAGCLIPQILVGVTDPSQLLGCSGSTLDLIIEAIDDAIPPPTDAGSGAATASVSAYTPTQRAFLAEARAKAVAAKGGAR
jgi:hypothetical protein